MRERRQTLLPTVLALTFVALLVTPLAAIAASGLPATITMRPEAADPGAQVEIVGLDFVAGEPVEIQLTTSAGPVRLATAMAGEGGYFRHAVTLPPDVDPGVWELRATGVDGAVAAHTFDAGGAATGVAAPVTAASATAGAARSSGFNANLLVMIVVLTLIAAIGGATAFVWYQLHRVDEDPTMAAGDDPIWSGAHSDT